MQVQELRGAEFSVDVPARITVVEHDKEAHVYRLTVRLGHKIHSFVHVSVSEDQLAGTSWPDLKSTLVFHMMCELHG